MIYSRVAYFPLNSAENSYNRIWRLQVNIDALETGCPIPVVCLISRETLRKLKIMIISTNWNSLILHEWPVVVYYLSLPFSFHISPFPTFFSPVSRSINVICIRQRFFKKNFTLNSCSRIRTWIFRHSINWNWIQETAALLTIYFIFQEMGLSSLYQFLMVLALIGCTFVSPIWRKLMQVCLYMDSIHKKYLYGSGALCDCAPGQSYKYILHGTVY